MPKTTRERLLAPAAVLLATASALSLSGCFDSAAANSSMMAIVVGNGHDGHDASVHKLVYPGDNISKSDSEDAYYVPAGPRNFFVGGANPDDKDPAVGRTKSGTPVVVELNAQWEVNQSSSVVTKKFWPYCLKYTCASTDPNAHTDNAAPTEGWTRMLSETFTPALEASVREVMPKYDDGVWRDQKGWSQLSGDLATALNKELRAYTQSTDPLFCGSGDNSGWKSGTAGQGDFTCGPITVQVSKVSAQNSALQQANADAAAAANQGQANAAALAAAVKKYGSAVAGSTLATIDIINACKAAGTNCTVVVGNGQTTVTAGK